MAFGKRLLTELRGRLLAGVAQRSDRVEELRQLAEMAADYVSQMKLAYIPQLPLELLIARWCLTVGSGYAGVSSQQAKAATPTKPSNKADLSIEQKPSEKPVAGSGGKAKVSLEEVKRRWAEMLSLVKPLNHSLEALLRSSRPAEAEGSRVTIEVFYKFHKDRLEQAKYREAIEDVLTKMFNGRVNLEFVLGSGRTKKPDLPIKSDPAGDELVKAAEEIFG
jgi:hypothetical protein